MTTVGLPIALTGDGQQVPCVDGTQRPYLSFDAATSTGALAGVLEAVKAFVPWYSGVHCGAGHPCTRRRGPARAAPAAARRGGLPGLERPQDVRPVRHRRAGGTPAGAGGRGPVPGSAGGPGGKDDGGSVRLAVLVNPAQAGPVARMVGIHHRPQGHCRGDGVPADRHDHVARHQPGPGRWRARGDPGHAGPCALPRASTFSPAVTADEVLSGTVLSPDAAASCSTAMSWPWS